MTQLGCLGANEVNLFWKPTQCSPFCESEAFAEPNRLSVCVRVQTKIQTSGMSLCALRTNYEHRREQTLSWLSLVV